MADWALVACEQSGPKADFVEGLARGLASRGARVGGFAQPPRLDERGDKGYELVRLSTGERRVLALGAVAPHGPLEELFCEYAFLQDGFALARQWLEQDAGADVLILDGISKLEIAGRGHARSLAFALALPAPKLVVVAARSSQLFYVMERFNLPEPVAYVELPAEEAERAAFARAVEQLTPR
jgi:nucleoside-triphosphatase THEP1